MVFCYKIITDSSQRARCLSPRRSAPSQLLPAMFRNCSNNPAHVEESERLLDELPEKEWRLLAVLARKREEAAERSQLARELKDVWRREDDDRRMAEMITQKQYKSYIHAKREHEKLEHEHRRLWKMGEQESRRRHLMDCIEMKERRSEDVQAMNLDRKTIDLVDKVRDGEGKAILAAGRRTQLSAVEEVRKRLELDYVERRRDEARRRKKAMLRDTSQRVAISNAINSWESSIALQELTALDLARRANHAARAAMTEARSVRIAMAKEKQAKRARRVAALSAQLRDMIRTTNM